VLPETGRLTETPGEGSPWREDSWIEGDSVVIYLSDEKVDSVRIIGSSKAMYYPVEGEEGKVSNNYSTGDTMFFRFHDQELNYVRISGRSTGIYNYLNLAGEETIDSIAAAIDSSLRYKDFVIYSEKVQYGADVIEYFADTEDIMLDSNATLKYQDKSLGARNINFNSRLNVLEAMGEPYLDEAGQKMYGFDMGYDMEYESGIVVDGSTKYDEGFYRGEHLFKVGKDILQVYNSTYTTCDFKSPHYSFRSKKMKVYIKDKVVSGPITLYIGEIPIFYLPFMVNSLRKDRHSGVLHPNFDIGMDSREGRFIRGLGYYWATNDYTDFKVTTDFNERRSFRLHLTNRYKIRYLLSGNVNLNFYRDLNNYTNEWTVESSHSQRFGPTASFRSNLRFVSSDKAQSAMDRSRDVSRYVDRRIYSSASFRKSWGGTKLSLSASRNQKLNVTSPTQSRISATMPSFSLNLPRTSLWFGEKHKEGAKGLCERALGSVMFSPNLSATRKTEESEAREKATLTARSGTGFSQQHKLLFINLSPSVSMNWNYSKVLYDHINPAYSDKVRPSGAYKNEFSMGFSSGFGTTLYGTFYPKIGALRGIRHTINPTVSYSYTPKLSENQVERKSVSYSLRNVIDLKVMEGGEEVKRNSVITWNLRGSYNPQLPKNSRFSKINSSLRSSLGNLLSFSVNHTIDPYEKEIISTNFNTGMTFGGAFSYPSEWRPEERERIAAARYDTTSADTGEAIIEEHRTGRPRERQSWSFNLNYNYSQVGKGVTRSVNSQLSLSGQLKLTRNWKISYSANYDIESKDFTQQQYSLKRDLHCWQASFFHRRFGDEWSYYFQIAIKDIPEIMYERGPRGLQSIMPF
ncbi:MAG: LPS-assembly protein LptD, partial [Candidatus Krumholzibacteria bacterium]|nr:LPS-assembly protein LptD [Candidatus Krumholzibacteria bacterium]